MALRVGLTALDESVAFEPFERVVDLPDVQRPGRSRAPVELMAQLIAVARPLIEDGEQALADGHGNLLKCLLSIYILGNMRSAQPTRRSGAGNIARYARHRSPIWVAGI